MLYRLLPVVGMRIHTRERAGQAELALVFFLRRQEDLPPVEFLHSLVAALRRTPFTAKYQVMKYKRGDCFYKYAAVFYITLTYHLAPEAGGS